jgi:hypothetical protein
VRGNIGGEPVSAWTVVRETPRSRASWRDDGSRTPARAAAEDPSPVAGDLLVERHGRARIEPQQQRGDGAAASSWQLVCSIHRELALELIPDA